MKRFFIGSVLLLIYSQNYAQVIIPMTMDSTIKAKSYFSAEDSTTCTYYFDSNGDVIFRQCLYGNGLPKRFESFANRTNNGLIIEWYTNGNMKFIANYLYGSPIGDYFEWYDNKVLKIKGTYKSVLADSLDLMKKKYTITNKVNPNDNTPDAIYSTSSMVEFTKDGVWLFYDENGGILKKEIWLNGKLR